MLADGGCWGAQRAGRRREPERDAIEKCRPEIGWLQGDEVSPMAKLRMPANRSCAVGQVKANMLMSRLRLP